MGVDQYDPDEIHCIDPEKEPAVLATLASIAASCRALASILEGQDMNTTKVRAVLAALGKEPIWSEIQSWMHASVPPSDLDPDIDPDVWWRSR